MTEHNPVEVENKRFALLVIVGGLLVLPIILAIFFGSWSIALAAWDLMVSQLG